MNPLAELLGESAAVVAIREQIEKLLPRYAGARRPPPLLIAGETGTGKGLLARLVHRAGPRADGPFVDVNCAAIPDTLLEAELFGFERGAFTDARQAKPGLFQTANRGTIFLDEIGLLPESLQTKLLTVLEERAVRRLGSTRTEAVDVVIISATNEDLVAATRERRFRADLYHRLAVMTLTLPPLRQRGGDVLLLAESFLGRVASDYGLGPLSFSADARAALGAYPWPGNVRELANVIERAGMLSESAVVTAAMLGLGPARGAAAGSASARAVAPGAPARRFDDDAGERERLLDALGQTSWNVSRAAALLNISRNTIRYRMEKHGLRSAVAEPQPTYAAAPAAPSVTEEARPASAGPVRWERRRITLLRVRLAAADPVTPTPESSRLVDMFLDKVRSFGGRVDDLGPNALLGVFGLEPVEDAPRRAVNAALALRRGAEGLTLGGGPARVTTVVHVGEATVGRFGATVEIEQESKRELLGLLERVVQGVGSDGIFVTGGATPFLGRRFDFVAVAGEPLPLFRLAGAERSGLGPGGGGRMARFVGRQQELELLRRSFESAATGHGQVLGIAGEAGIGKSRLLFESRLGLGAQPMTHVEAHCLSYGVGIPYLPVVAIVKTLCEVTDADTPDAVARKVRDRLRTPGGDPGPGAANILELLGIGEGPAAATPDAVRTRIFEAVTQLCLKQAEQGTLVLVIEDLHWSDPTSEEYFAFLADRVGGARILLVFTYRSGYRAPWLEKSYATQIALRPLGPQESADVLSSIVPPGRFSGLLVDLVIAKADGNPFFLEELSRTVQEQGSLGAAPTVPDTVQEVLLARLDRLPEREKSLLQAAAVIGRQVPFALLRAVAGLSDDDLRAALDRLRAAEFLRETSVMPERAYIFRHGLTHETVYDSLPAAERAVLHARIAGALEALHAGRLGEHLDRLAYHAVRAGTWEKALLYSRGAGARAFARSANREAVAFFEQALQALEQLPPTRETAEAAIDLRFDVRVALQPLGEFGPMLGHLREAERRAEALGDQRRRGRVIAYLTDYWRLMGDKARAVECGERALAIAGALDDPTLRVRTITYLGQVYHDAGEYRRAAGLFRDNLGTVTGERERELFGSPQPPSVHVRTCLAWCLTELGDFAEGLAVAGEGLRVAESLDQPLSLATAYSGIGYLHLRQGNLAHALPALERGVALSRAWNLRLWLSRLEGMLGMAYTLAGRAGEAVPLLQHAVAQGAAMRLGAWQAVLVGALGEARGQGGERAEGLTLGRRALALAREHQERGHEAWTLRLLAVVDESAAGEHAAQALRLARELGMRPLVGLCHLRLAELARRAGKTADLEEHLGGARRSFADLGMSFWAARAAAVASG
ncbi:MAG: sigma 54-interacting transcriptional regulator [Candidatus Rokubacteria bacterium]|nr:sigma 54-interacting transcriptional regulator [Candidatus Rokubacteria bacterium]